MASIKFSTPLTIGGMELKNRVIMSPMTRCRATADLVPTDRDAPVSSVVYYEQRASAGRCRSNIMIPFLLRRISIRTSTPYRTGMAPGVYTSVFRLGEMYR